MKRVIFWFSALCLLVSTQGYAIEGVYVGGQIGHVGMTGRTATTYSNTIGFGVDLGLRTNNVLDLTAAFQTSAHSGGAGMNLMSFLLTADYKFAEANDFEFFLSGGPGFYFFKTAALTDTKFGLNFGAIGNVMADENIRVGLAARYHLVFSSSAATTGDSYYSIMLRFGYVFPAGGA